MSTTILQTLRPLSKGGTQLPVGGRTYHFTRNGVGDYTAEVLDEDVRTILSISAGYVVYDNQIEPVLPGHEIVTDPPEVHEASARAIPQPPVPRGEHRPTNFGMKRKA